MKTKNKPKICIVGHGFVGKAIDYGFSLNTEKLIIDPIYGNNLTDAKDFNPDFIFICVPTPMGEKGNQDSSILEGVIDDITEKLPQCLIIIKSTVLPDILNEIQKKNKKVIYNPEFLREKHANEDFENAPFLIFGGNKEYCIKISELYAKHSVCSTKKYFFVDLETASFIKYSINSFLATKVLYFNELNALYSKLNVNDSWDEFTNIISQDSRIGKSHMNVPGHDGRKGFGGACFPKDTTALIKFSESLGVELVTLKSAINKNNKIRNSYNNLDSREVDQNITYNED
jgi:UDPglucose 6-dehydrogenase